LGFLFPPFFFSPSIFSSLNNFFYHVFFNPTVDPNFFWEPPTSPTPTYLPPFFLSTHLPPSCHPPPSPFTSHLHC
jgi:hypothetical protein